MKLLILTATVATLATGAALDAQAYYGGGRGGGGRGSGPSGELGAGNPGEAFPRPPRPVWNPSDTTRNPTPGENLPGGAPSTGGPATALPGRAPGHVPGAPTAQPGTPGVVPAGAPMDFTRAAATLRQIEIDWVFPVTPKAAQPLGWERAIRALAGTDRRPLLVRRHGHEVEAAGDRRIADLLDQEELRVMSRFFRCVDLADTSRHPDHPFSGLFHPERPPLGFVSDANGEIAVGFSGYETAADIYRVLYETLARAYEGDADRVVRGLRRGIEDFDRLLPREEELVRLVDDAVAEDGPDSPAARKQRQRLDDLRKELVALRARQTALSNSLKLRAAD